MSLQFYELGKREDVCKYDHIVSLVKNGEKCHKRVWTCGCCGECVWCANCDKGMDDHTVDVVTVCG